MPGRRMFLPWLAVLGTLGAGWIVARILRAEAIAPVDRHAVHYVGSAACRRCHPDQHASWHRTFHRTMTTEATPKNVRGDFGGATLVHAGVTTRMDRDAAGAFRMTFARPGEPPRVATVVRAVGSRRYQQYLAEAGGALWRLPVAYHLEERRWFPMTGAFLFADPSEADDGEGDAARPRYGGGAFDRHVTRWNDNCVFCHNVAPNPGRDPVTGTFDTHVAELGVACESCHGPGDEHVRRSGGISRRMLLRWAGGGDPTIVNPARLPPARAADLCGRCHGQRITSDVGPFLAHGDPFVPGDELARESAPLWRQTPLRGDGQAFAARFWADGTARLTAYEYQGLLQSRCAIAGALTCTSCHGMHEGDPRGQIRAAFSGSGADRMCTQCHRTLAGPEALAAHAHHDPAGEGARCLSCHMPRIVYGVLDVHRSHRVEVPAPAAAAAAGRPDACTNCHVAETAAWAETAVRRWRGEAGARPEAPRDGVSPTTQLIIGDPVARAVAADALGRAPILPVSPGLPGLPVLGGEGWQRRVALLLEVMLSDRFPAVRHLAWRSLGRLLDGNGPAASLAAGYDPSGAPESRRASIERLRATIGSAARLSSEGAVGRMGPRAKGRERERDEEIEIGE